MSSEVMIRSIQETFDQCKRLTKQLSYTGMEYGYESTVAEQCNHAYNGQI